MIKFFSVSNTISNKTSTFNDDKAITKKFENFIFLNFKKKLATVIVIAKTLIFILLKKIISDSFFISDGICPLLIQKLMY